MMYLNKIKEAGFDFERPKDDGELVEAVDSLLRERKLQARLFPLLSREHSIPLPSQKLVLDRWDKEGRPMFEVFAPYAFFCLRANFIWSLSLVNLDRPDKNDRKDLEYIYYLPRCEMFGSGDEKHQRLVPFLLRDDQTFVDGNELKEDLKRLSEKWEALSQEERIRAASQRRSAPPEDANSLIFRLWKKHRNQINKSIPLQVLDAQAVDSSQPSEEESQMSFGEFIRMKGKQLEASKELSSEELKTLRDGKTDPPTWAMRKTMMSKERILKRYPWLTADDLEKSNFD
jgi:hypothetical protein